MSITISTDLAEFIGIMVGDDGMYKTSGGRGLNIEINSGKDDTDYMENHVKPLVKKLFDKDIKVKGRSRENEIRIVICSKSIGKFLHDNFDLPYGNKGNIHIPKSIMNSNTEIKCSFLRGLFDTDFCFRTVKNNYPIINTSFKSSNLVMDLKSILEEFNISCHIKINVNRSYKESSWITNYIQISGRSNLGTWMKFIGSNNPKHLKKIEAYTGVQGISVAATKPLLSNPGPLA